MQSVCVSETSDGALPPLAEAYAIALARQHTERLLGAIMAAHPDVATGAREIDARMVREARAALPACDECGGCGGAGA